MVNNGAIRHCSAVLSNFSKFEAIELGDVTGINYKVKRIGDVMITVSSKQGKCVKIILKDVLFVPDLVERSKGPTFGS